MRRALILVCELFLDVLALGSTLVKRLFVGVFRTFYDIFLKIFTFVRIN